MYQELLKAFTSQPSDLKKTGSYWPSSRYILIGLIEAGLLIPQENASLPDLAVANWSLLEYKNEDIPSFDRYFSQLQTFYNDYSSVLPPSPREFPIRGLNLIRLLTQNRIAEFHTTLDHPINLERWLMEGSYSKVWNAREEAPAEEYKFFVDSLMGTIRNEIASCEEAAYNSLPIKDAATLLFFRSQPELLSYAQQRGWTVDLSANTITFTQKGEEKVEIPKEKLISANLLYARELEMIV
ncbi:COP9 signalosome [Irpex lacteus]|nr:COP9 signalosome [Irpex lacteus]